MRRQTIPLAVVAVFAAVFALAPAQRSAAVQGGWAENPLIVEEEEPEDETSAYYRNCAAARAAGAAPIYSGEPGYRAPLDRDGDGIACEPYRGR
jgi:hypothetical protein